MELETDLSLADLARDDDSQIIEQGWTRRTNLEALGAVLSVYERSDEEGNDWIVVLTGVSTGGSHHQLSLRGFPDFSTTPTPEILPPRLTFARTAQMAGNALWTTVENSRKVHSRSHCLSASRGIEYAVLRLERAIADVNESEDARRGDRSSGIWRECPLRLSTR